MGGSAPKYEIHGTVEPGFECIKTQFETNYNLQYDKHSQLCIYVGQKCVVDLYGKTNNSAYTADHTTNIWSSGKMVAAILMGIAQSKGWINYQDKVTTHWPEFEKSGCGKGSLTVADVMRHESNIENLDACVPLKDTLTENVKQN